MEKVDLSNTPLVLLHMHDNRFAELQSATSLHKENQLLFGLIILTGLVICCGAAYMHVQNSKRHQS